MYWISHYGLQFNMMLIQVYAPTDSEENKFDGFYGHVQSENNKGCKQSMVPGLGDWNSTVRNCKKEDIAGLNGLINRNETEE